MVPGLALSDRQGSLTPPPIVDLLAPPAVRCTLNQLKKKKQNKTKASYILSLMAEEQTVR